MQVHLGCTLVQNINIKPVGYLIMTCDYTYICTCISTYRDPCMAHNVIVDHPVRPLSYKMALIMGNSPYTF